MKEIMLPSGHIVLIDDDDYPLVSQFRWFARGRKSRPYARCYPEKKGVRGIGMHNLIMKPPAGLQVDHINRTVWTIDART